MIITSFYNLSPPSKKAQLIRQIKVEHLIKELGNKYLLANSIPKKTIKANLNDKYTK